MWTCIYVYVMTHLLKDGLCIKVTFMHNGCWVNYYEKHSLRWHICLTINQTTWLLWIMSSSWFDSILNLGKFTWTWQKRQSYIAILVAFFLHCTVFFTCLRGGMVTLIAFFTFLHCAFSNVSSNCLRRKMYNHTGCICLTTCIGHSLFHS